MSYLSGNVVDGSHPPHEGREADGFPHDAQGSEHDGQCLTHDSLGHEQYPPCHTEEAQVWVCRCTFNHYHSPGLANHHHYTSILPEELRLDGDLEPLVDDTPGLLKEPDYGDRSSDYEYWLMDEPDEAEDGIRDRSPSRGLGDVYKRQLSWVRHWPSCSLPWASCGKPSASRPSWGG